MLLSSVLLSSVLWLHVHVIEIRLDELISAWRLSLFAVEAYLLLIQSMEKSCYLRLSAEKGEQTYVV